MKKYLTFLLLILQAHLFAETINVSGKVVDENNTPIHKVNIYADTRGTITDKDGNFYFPVDNTALITFSHIGYKQITFSASEIPQNIVLDKNVTKDIEYKLEIIDEDGRSLVVYRKINPMSYDYFWIRTI